MILEALKLIVSAVAAAAGFAALAWVWGYCSRKGANRADEDDGLVIEEAHTKGAFQ